MAYCFTCASCHVLRSGRNAGALWCCMKSAMRAPDWVCIRWTEGRGNAVERDWGFDLPHHVQVKSGVESQFETETEFQAP